MNYSKTLLSDYIGLKQNQPLYEFFKEAYLTLEHFQKDQCKGGGFLCKCSIYNKNFFIFHAFLLTSEL